MGGRRGEKYGGMSRGRKLEEEMNEGGGRGAVRRGGCEN